MQIVFYGKSDSSSGFLVRRQQTTLYHISYLGYFDAVPESSLVVHLCVILILLGEWAWQGLMAYSCRTIVLHALGSFVGGITIRR